MDDIDRLLGIDNNDPVQRLAGLLVDADEDLLASLVEFRKRRGLSQADVAARLGITRPAVSAFERHDADPRLSTIRRYALAIGALVEHKVRDVDENSEAVRRVLGAMIPAVERRHERTDPTDVLHWLHEKRPEEWRSNA